MVMLMTETSAKLMSAHNHRTVVHQWSDGEEAPWHLAQSWCINIKYEA